MYTTSPARYVMAPDVARGYADGHVDGDPGDSECRPYQHLPTVVVDTFTPNTNNTSRAPLHPSCPMCACRTLDDASGGADGGSRSPLHVVLGLSSDDDSDLPEENFGIAQHITSQGQQTPLQLLASSTDDEDCISEDTCSPHIVTSAHPLHGAELRFPSYNTSTGGSASGSTSGSVSGLSDYQQPPSVSLPLASRHLAPHQDSHINRAASDDHREPVAMATRPVRRSWSAENAHSAPVHMGKFAMYTPAQGQMMLSHRRNTTPAAPAAPSVMMYVPVERQGGSHSRCVCARVC